MASPSKPFSRIGAGLQADANESGLIGGWNMRPDGVTLTDISGTANHGTIVRAHAGQSLLGDNLGFDGVISNVDIDVTVNDLATTTAGTWCAWIMTKDITATQEIISFGDTDADTRIQFDIFNNGMLRALAAETSTSQWVLDTDNVVFADNRWAHVVLVQNGTEPVLYVNGVAVDQAFSTDTDKTYWHNNLGGLDNGRVGCGNWNSAGNDSFFDGKIGAPVKVFDEAKSAAWVLAEFNRGKVAQWKTGWGTNVSSGGTTSGFLENSPFRVETGEFQISTDTIDGETVRVIECLTAGIVSIPTGYFQQSTADSAYGEWEWWAYKGADANTLSVFFIASTVAGGVGYNLDLRSDESIEVVEIGVGSKVRTLLDTVTNNQWNRYGVTRTEIGVTTVYKDGTAISADTGSNPFTDNTTVTSSFFLADMDAGDLIAVGTIDGGHAIRKVLV